MDSFSKRLLLLLDLVLHARVHEVHESLANAVRTSGKWMNEYYGCALNVLCIGVCVSVYVKQFCEK